MRLFWSLTFIVYLAGCSGWLSKEREQDSDISLYKTGWIVLKTESLRNILVFQSPHLKEPFPDGVLLAVMDLDWAKDGGGGNKVWSRMKSILDRGGEGICNFDPTSDKQNLTGAMIVEFEADRIQRVIDHNIYSDHPQLLNSEVYHVKFTEGVVTELGLSKGRDIFLAKGGVNSFRAKTPEGIDLLEYVELVSASQIGLSCRSPRNNLPLPPVTEEPPKEDDDKLSSPPPPVVEEGEIPSPI